MVAINHNKSQYQHSDFADYSKKTWEYWCEKNGVDFHCVTEHDDKYGYPINKVENGEPIIEDIKMYNLPYLKDEVTSLIMWLKDNS